MQEGIITIACFLFIFGFVIFSESAASLALDSWSSWMRCSDPVEKCYWKRMRSCINASDPHIACGEDSPWLDMRRNCQNCNGAGGWYMKSASPCRGSQCLEKQQDTIYACTDGINQPNCERILRKFCLLSKTCDGTWSSWNTISNCNFSKPLKGQIESKQRICYKNGTPSSDCKGLINEFEERSHSWCLFTSSRAVTSMSVETTQSTATPWFTIPTSIASMISTLKSTTAVTAQSKMTKRLTKPSLNGKFFKVDKKNELTTAMSDPTAEKNISNGCFWWDEKTYILIIQSVVILICFVVITYLVCSRSKRGQSQKEILVPVEMETKNLQSSPFLRLRSPSRTYNRFTTQYPHTESETEYDRMLNFNPRFSYPNCTRPLSKHPQLGYRPELPLPLHRPPNHARVDSRMAPATSDLFLNTPAISQRHFPHSAPTSPVRLRSDEQLELYSSVEDRYLRPIN